MFPFFYHLYIFSETIKMTCCPTLAPSIYSPPPKYGGKQHARKIIGCNPSLYEGKADVLANTLQSRITLLYYPMRQIHLWLQHAWVLLNHCSRFIKMFCQIIFTCLKCIFKVNSRFERENLDGHEEMASGYTPSQARIWCRPGVLKVVFLEFVSLLWCA